jgi:ribosomal-protein-alanine N-acetyltransferase
LNIIETDRLLMRPFELDDADLAYRWFGDERVMKYTPSGVDRSVQNTRERLDGYRAHQALHGFSKWLIVEHESGQPIGDAGLLILQELGWIDLGFRLAPAHWGKGLATEASSAWVRTAFNDLGIKRLGAFAHPDNAASIRVLSKLGFRSERRDTIMGMTSIYFGLESA